MLWEREKQEICKLKQVEVQYPLKSLFNNWMGTEQKVTVFIDYLITLNQPTYYLNMPTQISFLILHKTPDVDILLGIGYNIKQFCIAQGLTEDAQQMKAGERVEDRMAGTQYLFHWNNPVLWLTIGQE